MKQRSKQHKKILSDHFELACLFGLLICSVDLIWVIRDICHNGFEVCYGIILIGLLIGWIGTVRAVTKHHMVLYKIWRKQFIIDKAKALKTHRNKHKDVVGNK